MKFYDIKLQEISGKLKIDFKNVEALRVFTKCCLHKDFNLNINLPPNKLLPTIPLRLNYLLWIEDLLNEHKIIDNVVGIDIGCGSSCIYCLLATRSHGDWKMFALEIDDENLQYAKENIITNKLEEKITLISQKDDKIFGTLFEHSSDIKTFCMCNPPFFKSHLDLIGENRSGKRKSSKHAGSHHNSTVELIYEDGGEFGFIKKILLESLELKDKIKIYTTMIGCKKNLTKFINEMSSNGIHQFIKTEFVQGKTMRWGVAWSFCIQLKSNTEKSEYKKPNHKVLSHQIASDNFQEIISKIKSIFTKLEIEQKIIEENNKNFSQMELICHKNTWSNQRAKRRAEAKNLPSKFFKESPKNESLRIGMEVKKLKEENFVDIKMFYLDGNMNKDCVNQILQFIKNELNK